MTEAFQRGFVDMIKQADAASKIRTTGGLYGGAAGGLLGALIGAVATKEKKNRLKNAILAGLLGAGAGGGAGLLYARGPAKAVGKVEKEFNRRLRQMDEWNEAGDRGPNRRVVPYREILEENGQNPFSDKKTGRLARKALLHPGKAKRESKILADALRAGNDEFALTLNNTAGMNDLEKNEYILERLFAGQNPLGFPRFKDITPQEVIEHNMQ